LLRNFHEKGEFPTIIAAAPVRGAPRLSAHGHHAPLSKRNCQWESGFAVTGRRATEDLAAVSYVAGNVDDVTGMDDVVGQLS